MNIATLIFNPVNVRRYQINYPWLSQGEVISSSSASVVGDGSVVVDVIGLTVDQKGIIFMLSAAPEAIVGAKHLIDFQVTTSLGQVNYDRVTVIIDPQGCS